MQHSAALFGFSVHLSFCYLFRVVKNVRGGLAVRGQKNYFFTIANYDYVMNNVVNYSYSYLFQKVACINHFSKIEDGWWSGVKKNYFFITAIYNYDYFMNSVVNYNYLFQKVATTNNISKIDTTSLLSNFVKVFNLHLKLKGQINVYIYAFIAFFFYNC